MYVFPHPRPLQVIAPLIFLLVGGCQAVDWGLSPDGTESAPFDDDDSTSEDLIADDDSAPLTDDDDSAPLADDDDTAPLPDDDTELPADDAVVVSSDFPAELACGAEAAGTVVMKNLGTATWTRSQGFKLGAIDDSDPLHPGDVRIWLTEEDSIPPGGEHEFTISLVAGDEPGIFTTDWQMVHEAVTWFGETVSTEVEVYCEEEPAPLPLPDMSETVEALASAYPHLLANSCQDTGGTWEFLDLLVDELRLTDLRWGYNWKRGVIGDPSEDVVDYHYGPGVSEGSEDVYIIDVIVGHCGPNPSAGWLDQTQVTLDAGTIGMWTGRNRF